MSIDGPNSEGLPAAGPPAHWAADPTGRHAHRYWDGSEWTDHVADAGVPTIDPLVPAPPVAPQASWPPASPVPLTPAPPIERPLPPPPGTNLAPPAFAGIAPADQRWRSLDGLRTALVVLFSCAGVAAVAMLATLGHRLNLLDDAERNGLTFTRVHDINESADAVGTAFGIFSMLALAIGIVWIIWQWRCAKNAIALGRVQPRLGPGWSIGGWFIPFANFVLPILVMQDLWRASTVDTYPGVEWRRRKGTALIGWWWGVLIVAGFTYGANPTEENATVSDLQSTANLRVFGVAMLLVSIVLAMLVVIKLTRRFDNRQADLTV